MSRVGMSNFEEQQYALGRSWLSMSDWDHDTRRGTFRSAHGFVEVFNARHPRWTVTAIEFIHDGISYSRRWQTIFGEKTIARLARELVEEVIGR